MKRHNTDIAACGNDYCPSRTNCLRWQLGTNKDPFQVYGNFAPKSVNAQRCKFFVKGGER